MKEIVKDEFVPKRDELAGKVYDMVEAEGIDFFYFINYVYHVVQSKTLASILDAKEFEKADSAEERPSDTESEVQE